jgi:hypothetical protein
MAGSIEQSPKDDSEREEAVLQTALIDRSGNLLNLAVLSHLFLKAIDARRWNARKRVFLLAASIQHLGSLSFFNRLTQDSPSRVARRLDLKQCRERRRNVGRTASVVVSSRDNASTC